MMKNPILKAGLLFLALAACNKKTESTETVVPMPKEVDVEKAPEKECYEFVRNKDTVTLSLVQNANNVNGELAYKWAEKDSNKGTLSGIFIGDTLYADYTFQSEGSTSVREVAFLKSGNTIIEGFGDVEEKASKQTFKNPKALKFDKSLVLVKTACK